MYSEPVLFTVVPVYSNNDNDDDDEGDTATMSMMIVTGDSKNDIW